ncbi:MAG: chalcone isomerase family protein [Hahellaceae bacterium]|jgi:hypothetical protein|nr:chalcone isomerase family protein [Hahellaceae bacterium]
MKQTLAAFLASALLAGSVQAATVAGVDIPDTFDAAGKTLNLNGAGVRSKFFMDVYVGGLYLQDASQDAAAIVKGDAPMSIKLHMISGLITSDKMKTATSEGFVNATGGNLAPIQASVDKFMAAFNEEIVENDVFDIVYVPGKGVEVYKNEELVDTIDGGMAFKEALFGIWLSEKPAQEDLKAKMLGK